jgi:hypothetical protein
MTRDEVIQLLAVIKATYPRWAGGLKADDARNMVIIWSDLLGEFDGQTAMKAARAVILDSEFPPSIAEIVRKIRLLEGVSSPATGMEAWGLVRKAIKNGNYRAKEEFDKLPLDVQNAIGTHYAIKEWSAMTLSDLETVIQSQFIKSFNAKMATKLEIERLPLKDRQLLEGKSPLQAGRLCNQRI